MEIKIKRINKKYHFQAESENGTIVNVDASSDIGGENKGVRSMELLLMAIGTCSSIDLISILKKQRQELEDITIDVRSMLLHVPMAISKSSIERTPLFSPPMSELASTYTM